MPIVARRADALVSWGSRVAREHPGAERFGERLVIVYPPVDVAEFAPDREARSRARARLGAGGECPLVGTVGVRIPHKGHLDLVRAAAIVRRRHPEATFRILGAPSPSHPATDPRLAEEAARLGVGIPDDLALVDPGDEVPSLIQ